MKLISFDIGIKNMAYCILSKDTSGTDLMIRDWNVLNLMDSEEPKHKCTCVNQPKSKKNGVKPCATIAKYTKNGDFFCDKHAKKSTQFLMPTKQRSLTGLKKLKVDELLKLGNSHMLFIDIENPEKLLKKEMLDKVASFFNNQCFEPIVSKKEKSAADTDLVNIGKNMKTLLNQLPEMDGITHVVIENQISPIANRMKTIQGMLAQYFIMKNSDIVIEFVSSANKLKDFYAKSKTKSIEKTGQAEPLENTMTKTVSSNYKKHKTDGVLHCSQFLEANRQFHSWKESLLTTKKDDLADSFLQGLWYLKHRNIIIYADDLKINIVSLS